MKLKRINAIFALLSALMLILHMGYTSYVALTYHYDPLIVKLTAVPFMVCVCIHAVLGMCSLFLLGDGTRIDYPKLNKRTVIQRISAALIFPLLIIHLKSYEIMSSASEADKAAVICILIIIQLLFFVVITVHTASSFSNAFITLGMLKSRDAQRKLDRIAYVVFTAVLIFAAFAVIRTEIAMFLLK